MSNFTILIVLLWLAMIIAFGVAGKYDLAFASACWGFSGYLRGRDDGASRG